MLQRKSISVKHELGRRMCIPIGVVLGTGAASGTETITFGVHIEASASTYKFSFIEKNTLANYKSTFMLALGVGYLLLITCYWQLRM